MTQLLSRLVGALSSLWGYAALSLLAATLASVTTGFVIHRMDNAAIAAVKLKDQRAQTEAIKQAARVQQSQDQVNLNAALAEAEAQQKIVTVTHTIVREIPAHVSEALPCIPYGLVRLLDDAATGGDTANVPAPAGQSDEACAPLSWRAFADELIDDYGIGRSNAEQLNALEADVQALVAAANTKSAEGDEK
jgi:hypothetical protein